MVVSSPQRLLSRRSLRRSGRRRHGSASESDGDSILAKQVSLDQQMSVISDGGFHGSTADLKRITSQKQQEEWDKDIPKVGTSTLYTCHITGASRSKTHSYHSYEKIAVPMYVCMYVAIRCPCVHHAQCACAY